MNELTVRKVKDYVVEYTVLVDFRGESVVVSWDPHNGYDFDTPPSWTQQDEDDFVEAMDQGLDINVEITEVSHA